MFVIFLGPPGVGKGTQSQRLTEALQIPHISTGDMLRTEMESGSDLGRTIAEHLKNGQLVSDEMINRMVLKRLHSPDCASGCLLDGYPRTIEQAKTLDHFLSDQGYEIRAAILLVADEEEVQRRLLARAKIEGRSDDTRETIAKRMQVYQLETAPLVDYYRRTGALREVDAMGSPDVVFARIEALVRDK